MGNRAGNGHDQGGPRPLRSTPALIYATPHKPDRVESNTDCPRSTDETAIPNGSVSSSTVTALPPRALPHVAPRAADPLDHHAPHPRVRPSTPGSHTRGGTSRRHINGQYQ